MNGGAASNVFKGLAVKPEQGISLSSCNASWQPSRSALQQLRAKLHVPKSNQIRCLLDLPGRAVLL